ncbi:MAG: ABC transporter permease [Actinomycetota bacterium]
MDRPVGLLEETAPPSEPGKRPPQRKEEGVWYPRWYWPSFAGPAFAWLILLFILPFYVILSVAMGTVDPVFQTPIPVWQPWYWSFDTFKEVVGKIFGVFGELPLYQPSFVRTIVYVLIASSICVLLAYPVAYYVARYGGRRRTLFLALLVAPFWVSYLMRMLAWTNLLQSDGFVNRVLGVIGFGEYQWLEGKSVTVVLGLIYGYIPYMILPLYAGLDRINQSLMEASRDLGASPSKTFWKVTLPLSKPAVLAGMVIVSLPMFGDYYTTYLLSSRGRTSMIGTLIDQKVHTSGDGPAQAAALVMILMLMLIPFMLYYLRSTRSEEI